jgi:cell wall-associated NlpC family hydrolase
MADEVTKTKYTFTPAEAAFFARQAQEAANMQTALQAAQRSALLMVLTQQGLQGNWRLAEDGTDRRAGETASRRRSELSEIDARQAVVQEAREFLGTKYVLGGRVKGAGVDCFTLISEVLIRTGNASPDDVLVYSQDWFMHAKREEYMLRLMRNTVLLAEAVAHRRVDAAQPGDIVLVRTIKSRVFSHGGIVTVWPRVIHAMAPAVEEIDAATHPLWSAQRIRIYHPWAWGGAATQPEASPTANIGRTASASRTASAHSPITSRGGHN